MEKAQKDSAKERTEDGGYQWLRLHQPPYIDRPTRR